MPDELKDIYEIELKLKTNWSKILDVQSKNFENFIQKANTSTRSLERSLTSMQQNLGKSYEGMFQNSRKQIEAIAQFSKSAITGISKSTTAIMGEVFRSQDAITQRINKQGAALEKYRQKAESIAKAGLAKGDTSAVEREQEKFNKLVSVWETGTKRLGQVLQANVSKMLGEHFANISEGILKQSQAVKAGTEKLINDTLSQWNRIKSQTQFMDKTPAVVHKAAGIVEMEAQQKQVYANLDQLAKQHAQAQETLRQQEILRQKATTDKVKQFHEDMAFVAAQNLDKIQKEYIETSLKVEEFAEKVREAKMILGKSGGAEDLLKSWKEQLKPSRIASMLKPIRDNMVETMSLVGKGMTDELVKSVQKGDQLKNKLGEFKNSLTQIKNEAALLSKAGLINPDLIAPKIKRAEEMLKQFEMNLKNTKKEIQSFTPTRLADIQSKSQLQNFLQIRKEIASLSKPLPTGKITPLNFEDTSRAIDQINSKLVAHKKLQKQVYGEIANVQKEIASIEAKLVETSNVSMRQRMKENIDTLTKYVGRMKSILSQSTLTFDESNLRKEQAKLLSYVKSTMQSVKATLAKTDLMPMNMLNQFNQQYEHTISLIDKASKRKFFRVDALNEAKSAVGKLEQMMMAYKNQIIVLEGELKKLETIHRRGFKTEGVRQATAEVKNQIGVYKQYMSQVQSAYNYAIMRMRDTAKISTTGLLKSAWTMIRNFRWQVAAIIYLVQWGIRSVKRIFMDTMNEIAQFRKDAMSLAAQYSFQMFGDMKENFQKAYKFSTDLLMKMQIVAAETMLTLEDMTMLVKTFAQAGIMPRTDEDLQKIATIGTAIKALTEGMANAGVQMKQELYAIIAGRQRATDQLAMMFKLQGKNIQKMIDDAKKEGKSMIDVLSEALKPFSVMNDALKNEWQAVINKLEIVWKWIKRIALEDFLLESTKAMQNFIAEFWNKSEGLTKKGRDLAAALRGGFEVTKVIVSGVWEIIKEIANILGIVVRSVYNIVGGSTQVDNNVNAINSSLKGTLASMELMMKGTWLVKWLFIDIARTITAIISPVNYLIDAFKALGNYAGAIGLKISAWFSTGKVREAFNKAAAKQWEEGTATITKANQDLIDAGQKFLDMAKDANKNYDEIEKTVENILKLLDAANQKAQGIGVNYQLTYPTGVFDEWYKMQSEYQRAEAEQYKGPKRFEIEARQKIEALDEIKFKTKKNIEDLKFMEEDHRKGVLKMTKEQFEDVKAKLTAHQKILGDVYKYESWIIAERNRKTSEYNLREAIQRAKDIKEYKQFIREVTNVPTDPLQKVADWYEEVRINLEELLISNPEFVKQIKQVGEAVQKGAILRSKEAVKDMNEEYDKWINKASKADAWNTVFDDLNAEFDEYVRQIEKTDTLDKGRKKALKEQFELIKGQRKEQEYLNIAFEANLSKLDVSLKKANYLRGSYSPIKQRQGELMELRTTHDREMAEMAKKLEEFNMKWKQNGQWIDSADASVKAMGADYEETMRQMTIATEREIQKKQMPIWSDIVDASNSWADGFTDSLSQIVDGIDSVSEALNELQKQILKDALKAVIKNTITDRLQDMLGSGIPGEEGSPLQKWFGIGGTGKGKEKGPQEIIAKQPLPVYITNVTAVPTGLPGTSEIAKKFAKEQPAELPKGIPLKLDKNMSMTTSNPIPVFVTNMPQGGMFGGGGIGDMVKGEQTKTVEEATKSVEGVTKQIEQNTQAASEASGGWLDKIKSGFSSFSSGLSSIFSQISTGFSGFMSNPFSTAGGAGSASFLSTVGNLGLNAGTMMAEGGVIKEPILGKGLKSGEIYNFGEKTKYGENELVAPMSRIQETGSQTKIEYHMPINLSSIDTQSGVQFLMRHSDVIQGQFAKSLRQNKPIRKGLQNAY